MAETTLTSAGLDYIAGIALTGTDSATILAVGDGIPSGSGLGSEHTGNGFARTSGDVSYSSEVLTVSKTFTASGADIQVTEAALYTTESTPTLIGYVHFGEFDLPNNGVITDGNSVYIAFTISVSSSGTITSTITGGGGVASEISYTGITVSIILTGSASIDPTNFPCVRHGLCFNGIPIKNGNISNQTGVRGGRIWEITGYTDDFTDIQNLEAYASPVSIGKTITGVQSVSSVVLPGVFKIWNGTDHTIEENCWIVDNISSETFGVGWWFGLTIVQGV